MKRKRRKKIEETRLSNTGTILNMSKKVHVQAQINLNIKLKTQLKVQTQKASPSAQKST